MSEQNGERGQVAVSDIERLRPASEFQAAVELWFTRDLGETQRRQFANWCGFPGVEANSLGLQMRIFRHVLSHLDTYHAEQCNMGVGCEEAGVCYAAAHGEPDRCPISTPAPSALAERHEAMLDSQYRAGAKAGWNAQFAENPDEAIAALIKYDGGLAKSDASPPAQAEQNAALVELVARVLYDCEKERSDRCDAIISAAAGKTVTVGMEPWSECWQTFHGDAERVLATIRKEPQP